MAVERRTYEKGSDCIYKTLLWAYFDSIKKRKVWNLELYAFLLSFVFDILKHISTIVESSYRFYIFWL